MFLIEIVHNLMKRFTLFLAASLHLNYQERHMGNAAAARCSRRLHQSSDSLSLPDLSPISPNSCCVDAELSPRSSSHPRQPSAALLKLKMEYRRGWEKQPVGNEAHWTGTVTRPFKVLWCWNLTLHSSAPPFLLEQKAQRHGSLALRPQTQPPRLQIGIKTFNPD